MELTSLGEPGNRRTVLLAELAGWLHVVTRLQKEFKNRHVLVAPSFPARKAEADEQVTIGDYSGFQDSPFELLGEKTSIGTLAMCWQRYLVSRWPGELPLLFLDCHVCAHNAKIGKSQDYGVDPEPGTTTSNDRTTVFGYRVGQGSKWTAQQWADAFLRIAEYAGKLEWASRIDFLHWYREATRWNAAESRAPLNDIGLLEYGTSVAVLFRAAVAKSLLEGRMPEMAALKAEVFKTSTPANTKPLQWRLLSVRLDGLSYLGRANAIPDITARREMVENGLDAVRYLLEWEYPIGSEIYRDENGSVFVVPDLEGVDEQAWLKLGCGGVSLGSAVWTAFARADAALDIRPVVSVSAAARGYNLPICEAVGSYPKLATVDPESVKAVWKDRREAEVCTSCGLRPQAEEYESGPAHQQGICVACQNARNGRCRAWAASGEGRRRTIWIDEVADENGRCALIAARFELHDWLEGELIRTLVAGYEKGTKVPVWKEDSFTRIQGVWHATKGFWERFESGVAKEAKPQPRLRLRPAVAPAGLGRNNAYEIDVRGIRLGVVWTGEAFLTAGNLHYFVSQLEPGVKKKEVEERATEILSARLKVFESRGYERREQSGRGTERELASVDLQATGDSMYTPSVIILREPQTYIEAVPAADALERVDGILKGFDAEFGQVRDRLGIAIGVVVFQRRTPVYAAMNAARRMLRMPIGEVEATVGDGAMADIRFGALKGDEWYGYRRLAAGGKKQTLEAADVVRYAESRLDWAYLGTAAQRFRVAYLAKGGEVRRLDPGDAPRPYTRALYAEIERVWKLLQGVERSQLSSVMQAIEEKRAEWTPGWREEFEKFTAAAIRNMHWIRGRPGEEDSRFLERAAVSGLLRDAVELHLKALKEKRELTAAVREAATTGADK